MYFVAIIVFSWLYCVYDLTKTDYFYTQLYIGILFKAYLYFQIGF